MNRSIVVTRYARALEKYVRETGNGAAVSAEASRLLRSFGAAPQLQRMMAASPDVVSPAQKSRLLRAALDNEMSPELSRFVELLNRNGRMDLVQDILRDFAEMMRRSLGFRRVQVRCTQPPTEEFLGRLGKLIGEKTGDRIQLDVQVDESLLGGFVLDMDDYLLDASVKRQLALLREQFIISNRRLI